MTLLDGYGKSIPTAGLLAHVMIAKFADNLPLYRQESIFGRVGLNDRYWGTRGELCLISQTEHRIGWKGLRPGPRRR